MSTQTGADCPSDSDEHAISDRGDRMAPEPIAHCLPAGIPAARRLPDDDALDCPRCFHPIRQCSCFRVQL